jgi:hypothetical protein
MGPNLIGRMNDVLWGYFIHRLSSSHIYAIPTSGRCSQRRALIAKIRLLKGAGHSELTGHHVIAQSSCNTTFSPIFYVPDCYSESGKGDAAITSTALGAL